MSAWRRVAWVIVIGAATSAAIAFTRKKGSAPHLNTTNAAAPSSSTAPMTSKGALPFGPLNRPADATVEFGVMTEMDEQALQPLLATAAAARLLEARHCGDPSTCEAVRAYVEADEHVSLEVVPPLTWSLPDEPERAASDLSESERESLPRRRVIVVHTGGRATPKQLAARAGFALAGALAEKTNGVVYDQVIDRVDRAVTFVKRAITEPLDAHVFRSDRIDVQYAQTDREHMRLLTTGLARFGCPDIDILEAHLRDVQPLSDVLTAAAEAVVNGAISSPLTLTRGDLERVRGSKYDEDAGAGGKPMPEVAPVAVGIENVHPENGDPNDFMARIVPEDGPTPEGYAELAAAFFGEAGPPPPEQSPEEAQAQAKSRVDKELPSLLDRSRKGVTLYLQFPFAVPPDEDDPNVPADAAPDYEWMWVEVKSFDAKTVTGVLMDQSDVNPALPKGQTVTRARMDALDYQLKLPDGAIEGAQ